MCFYVLFNVFLRCFGQVVPVKSAAKLRKIFHIRAYNYNVMKHKNGGRFYVIA